MTIWREQRLIEQRRSYPYIPILIEPVSFQVSRPPLDSTDHGDRRVDEHVSTTTPEEIPPQIPKRLRDSKSSFESSVLLLAICGAETLSFDLSSSASFGLARNSK